MTDQINLSFKVTNTDYSIPLGLKVSLDHIVIYENAHVSSELQIQHAMSDDDGAHELTFELFGKLPDHTRIDDAGNIVSDAVLDISDIEIDGIDINYLYQQSSVYHHDYNGTKPALEDKFFGCLGCNGTVRFRFTTPIYIWLLENM